MFAVDKNKLSQTIHILQRKSCSYDMGNLEQDPPSFCDCKYGWSGERKSLASESNSCPELRLVHKLLETMTEEEYQDLVRRANGIIL